MISCIVTVSEWNEVKMRANERHCDRIEPFEFCDKRIRAHQGSCHVKSTFSLSFPRAILTTTASMQDIVVDLSHTLNATTRVFPGDPVFSSCPHLTLSADGVNVQHISMGSHTGTHIDAPFHFIASGKTVDELPLDLLIGPTVVVDLTRTARGKDLQEREIIQWNSIAPYEQRIKQYIKASSSVIVLLRTGWSAYWDSKKYVDHPYLSAEAAQQLIDIGVRVIGIDAFSPDQTLVDPQAGSDATFEAHNIILGAGGIIAENLTNLDLIQDGDWTVSLTPLKLEGSDGSPVRACAWRKGQR
ncbi:putative cyclase [Trametopsis cervina]|nr:putative cyclase [Trametopsis cervina]